MKLINAFAAFLALAATTTFGQVILIDYGDGAATPTLGGTWNTVDSALTGSALVDTTGAATGVTIGFAGAWLDTTVDQGPWPAGNVGWVDGLATADYTFSTSDATVTFSGLAPGAQYKFEHVAARSLGADRRADYLVNLNFADSTPNGDDFFSLADGWDGGNILVWNSVTADTAGEITLSVIDVQAFGYVNASRLMFVPEPGSLILWGLGLCSVLVVRRAR